MCGPSKGWHVGEHSRYQYSSFPLNNAQLVETSSNSEMLCHDIWY